MSLHRNLRAGWRISFQTDSECISRGEILGRFLDCDDDTVIYKVRDTEGYVRGVSPCDVLEVLVFEVES